MNLHQAAEQIDTPPNTLRLWCTVFADFLSPPGEIENGQYRELTDDDLKVLYTVKRAKDSGYTVEQIKEILTEAKAKGYRRLQSPPPPASFSATPVTVAPLADTEKQLRAMVRELENRHQQIQVLRARVDTQSARILEIERQNAAMAKELRLWRAGRLRPDR